MASKKQAPKRASTRASQVVAAAAKKNAVKTLRKPPTTELDSARVQLCAAADAARPAIDAANRRLSSGPATKDLALLEPSLVHEYAVRLTALVAAIDRVASCAADSVGG